MGNIIYPLWADCPALTRLVCVGYPSLSLLMLAVTSSPVGWMVDFLFICSLRAAQHLHVWTLCISAFYSSMLGGGLAFLMALFEVYMSMVQFPTKEREMGSTAFLLWMFLVNALVNMVHLAIMLAFATYYHDSFTAESYLQRSNNGLWPVIMVVITLKALSDPQGSTNFWGLAQIPNKWYPIALTAFFFLLSGLQILWNFVAALIVGYAYVFLRFDRYMPSAARAGRLEQRFPCCRGGRCTALGAYWVSAASTPGYGYDTGGADRRYATLGDFGRSGGQQLTAAAPGRGGAGFQAFSGQGITLGDGSGEGSSAQAPAATPSAPAPGPELHQQPREDVELETVRPAAGGNAAGQAPDV